MTSSSSNNEPVEQHAVTRSHPQKKTDFFLAGNSKSGTTALYKFLRQHPEICMCFPKELNIFAKDFVHEQDVGRFTRKTLGEYPGYFDDPSESKLWGEASACYLYSSVAAKEIYDYNPEAKIIAIFREPVDFLHSYHLQMLTNPVSEGEVEKDFERALELEAERKQGHALPDGCLIPPLLYYSERVKYVEHLERFYARFDEDQVLVLIYEDFKADNEGVFQRILQFLEVDPTFRPATFRKHNKGRKLRSKIAQRLVYNLSHGIGALAPLHAFIKRLVPASVREFLIQNAYQHLVFKPKPGISSELERRLKAEYKPHVEKLSALIDRDLVAEWEYEDV